MERGQIAYWAVFAAGIGLAIYVGPYLENKTRSQITKRRGGALL
jgi:hypothetical protein